MLIPPPPALCATPPDHMPSAFSLDILNKRTNASFPPPNPCTFDPPASQMTPLSFWVFVRVFGEGDLGKGGVVGGKGAGLGWGLVGNLHAVRCSTARCAEVRSGLRQCGSAQCGTVYCSPVCCSAARYREMRCNGVSMNAGGASFWQRGHRCALDSTVAARRWSFQLGLA